MSGELFGSKMTGENVSLFFVAGGHGAFPLVCCLNFSRLLRLGRDSPVAIFFTPVATQGFSNLSTWVEILEAAEPAAPQKRSLLKQIAETEKH